MPAKKKPAASNAPISRASLPAIGAPLAGGLFVGIARAYNGAPDYAIALLGDEPGRMNHKDAVKWAEKLGASLPTRDEARICYANLRDNFKPEAHWTIEQYAGDDASAWSQGFGGGTQGSYRKYYELRARAVRRLPIQ